MDGKYVTGTAVRIHIYFYMKINEKLLYHMNRLLHVICTESTISVLSFVALLISSYSSFWCICTWCNIFEVDVDVRDTVDEYSIHSTSNESSWVLKYLQTKLRFAFKILRGVVVELNVDDDEFDFYERISDIGRLQK
jgi:hypothetical protein